MQSGSKPKKTKLQAPCFMASDSCPDVRYFQVHFEYLDELLNTSIVKIDALNKQVNQLEKRLASALKEVEIAKRRTSPYDSFSIQPNLTREGDALQSR